MRFNWLFIGFMIFAVFLTPTIYAVDVLDGDAGGDIIEGHAKGDSMVITEYAIIKANAFKVRDDPDLNKPAIGQVKKGDKLEVAKSFTKEKNNWLTISVDGKIGYILNQPNSVSVISETTYVKKEVLPPPPPKPSFLKKHWQLIAFAIAVIVLIIVLAVFSTKGVGERHKLAAKNTFYRETRVPQIDMENNITKPNCIIIHGCPSNVEKAMSPETRTYDKHWIPWLKKELVARGIETETPLMPTPWNPDYEKFKAEFEKYEVGENTILVGHSCGSAFLVRWLGETKREIFKLILVAPWKIPNRDDEFQKAFYIYPIDESIKSRANKIVLFTADDEEGEGKESLKIFHQALGGEIIELKGRGHYTMSDMGTEEFPELLEVVLK